MVDEAVKSKKHHNKKGTFELIEEAVHLLRRSPLSLLAPYYIGSLPFVLGLMFFWSDMKHNAFAAERCAAASLGLALLFLWMKCWQTAFMDGIIDQLIIGSEKKWTFKRVLSLSATQAILQPFGLIFPFIAVQGLNPSIGLAIIPFIVLMTIPFAWCYAFFQNVSVLGNGHSLQIGNVICESWAQAKFWSGQNIFVLLVFFLFGFFVFLNINMAIQLIPGLLKIFFDVETHFTISAAHIKNTTFFFMTLNLTYLCLDPLIKTIYVLRCFYGESIANGEDLKADLKSFQISRKVGMTALVFLLIFGFAGMSLAEKKGNTAHIKKQETADLIKPSELDDTIKGVLSQREFTWRMPREKQETEDRPENFVTKIMDSVNQFIQETFDSIKRAIKKFLKWLLSSEREIKQESKPKDIAWVHSVRFFLYAIIAILVCFALFLGLKLYKNRTSKKAETGSVAASPQPDLNDENVSPADFASNQWNQLADRLIKEGSLRLALRAIYLGILAHLSESHLIYLAKYKSNRDYLLELRRREHVMQGLVTIFSNTVKAFDKAWYGMYDVALEDLKLFRSQYERIQNLVKA